MESSGGISSPTAPHARRSSDLALLVAAALALVLGVQLLRVFLPLATFYLHDAGGLPPLATAGISLVVFAMGLRAPALARRFGWRKTVRIIAGVLAGVQIAEQAIIPPQLTDGSRDLYQSVRMCQQIEQLLQKSDALQDTAIRLGVNV